MEDWTMHTKDCTVDSEDCTMLTPGITLTSKHSAFLCLTALHCCAAQRSAAQRSAAQCSAAQYIACSHVNALCRLQKTALEYNIPLPKLTIRIIFKCCRIWMLWRTITYFSTGISCNILWLVWDKLYKYITYTNREIITLKSVTTQTVEWILLTLITILLAFD